MVAAARRGRRGGLRGRGRRGGLPGRGLLGLAHRALLGLALGALLRLAAGALLGLEPYALLGLLPGALLLGAEDRLALGHDVADRARDHCAGADRVIVAGDHEVDPVRVAVRVDQPDDRDAQPLGLAHRDDLGLEVDDEHRVGRALHVLDAAEVGAQLGQVRLGGQPLAGRQQRQLALVLVALEVVQALDALADGLEVRQQATEPAVVDVRHAGRLGAVLDRVTGLLLRADEEDDAAAVGQCGGELLGILEQRLRLQEVDDVDAAALAVDEAAHLRVPASRLVAEVDAGLQELAELDLGHGAAPLCLRVVVDCARAVRLRTRSSAPGRAAATAVRDRGRKLARLYASSGALRRWKGCGPASPPSSGGPVRRIPSGVIPRRSGLVPAPREGRPGAARRRRGARRSPGG